MANTDEQSCNKLNFNLERCEGKLQMFFDSILMKTCVFPMRYFSDACALQHELTSVLIPSHVPKEIEISSIHFYNAWYTQQSRYNVFGNAAVAKICANNSTFTYRHIAHPFTHELIEDLYSMRLRSKMPGVMILSSQYIGNTLDSKKQ